MQQVMDYSSVVSFKGGVRKREAVLKAVAILGGFELFVLSIERNKKRSVFIFLA